MKSLSIVIPVYNGEKFIENCIESIAKQDNGKIEVVMVNDGSKDNSAEICLSQTEKYPFIKYFEKENGGVSSARNFALDKITGEYVWFVDVDDEIEPNSIKEIFKIDSSIDLGLFNYRLVINESEKIVELYDRNKEINIIDKDNFFEEYVFRYKLANGPLNKIYKTEIIKNNNIRFNENLAIGEDFEFNLKYYKQAKNAVACPVSIYVYLIRSNSAMTSKNPRAFEFQMTIAESFYKVYNSELKKQNVDRFLLMQLICAIGQSKARGLGREEIISKVKQYKEKFNVTFSKAVVKEFLRSENAGLLGKLRVKLVAWCFNKNKFSILKKII